MTEKEFAGLKRLIANVVYHDPQLLDLIPEWFTPETTREEFLRMVTEREAQDLDDLPMRAIEAAALRATQPTQGSPFIFISIGNLNLANIVIGGVSQTENVLQLLQQDLERALVGETPLTEKEKYLELFQLDGPFSDGKTFAERIIPSLAFGSIRKLSNILTLLEILMQMYEEKNTQVEPMIIVLAAIGDRQIVREGDVCPLAKKLALRLMKIKPDFFSQKAQDILNS